MKPGLAILPLEVWADIFLSPWFTRQELAKILNGTRNRDFANKLDKLLHGCGKQTLGFLKISKLKKNSSKCQARKRKVPVAAEYCASLAIALRGNRYKDCEFPECEMPENIVGFKELAIRHVDDQVLNILDKIRPLFTDVFLNIGTIQSEENVLRILLSYLLPMLGGIRAIICKNECVELFESHFPGTLTLAKELDMDFRATTPASIPTYLYWLAAAQNFDQHGPRFLKIVSARPEIIMAMVDAVHKQFLEATASSTFVIFLEFFLEHLHQDVNELSVKNATTNEQLCVRNAIFYKPMDGHIHYVEIVRHTIDTDAKVREWIKEQAYYEKLYKDEEADDEVDDNEEDEANDEDEEQQVISIGWPILTIGRITNRVDGMNEGENELTGEEDEAGPSTSAKKMKK